MWILMQQLNRYHFVDLHCVSRFLTLFQFFFLSYVFSWYFSSLEKIIQFMCWEYLAIEVQLKWVLCYRKQQWAEKPLHGYWFRFDVIFNSSKFQNIFFSLETFWINEPNRFRKTLKLFSVFMTKKSDKIFGVLCSWNHSIIHN